MLIIFQGFHIFIDLHFHILDSLLNFIHGLLVFFLSTFYCLFTFSLMSNTNFCVSSLRMLIIFTLIFGNSLFDSSSFMQVFESLVELAFDGEWLSYCFIHC
jgi:hypothetical protein